MPGQPGGGEETVPGQPGGGEETVPGQPGDGDETVPGQTGDGDEAGGPNGLCRNSGQARQRRADPGRFRAARSVRRGRESVRAGSLRESRTGGPETSATRTAGRTGEAKRAGTYRHKYRDLYKELDDALVHLFIGTELQEHVDYAMPLRAMDSDVLSYLHQKKTVGKNHTNDKDVREDTEDAEDTENAENTGREGGFGQHRKAASYGRGISVRGFPRADRLQQSSP